MIATWSDSIKVIHKAYMEPVLLTASRHQGGKIGLTVSKYIRRAVIEKLVRDGYPLDKVSTKFKDMDLAVTA